MLADMVSRTRLKSLLTGLALYTMAGLMVGYFGVNAYTGKYGLNARQELDQEIIALTSELARLKRERAEGEQRVSLLRSDRVDPDMLDERARFQLDYANPRDLVRIVTPASGN
jgi:cell division protein FtsB